MSRLNFPDIVDSPVHDFIGENFSSSIHDSGFTHHFCNSHRIVYQTGLPNYVGARLPVPSQLDVPMWRRLLQDYDDFLVCDFLDFGWPLGYTKLELPVFDVRAAHRGALNFPQSVTDYLASEVTLGHISGPFAINQSPFPDKLIVSPLNMVEKRDSTERRVIVDLSWPDGTSVNDGIPTDSFLGTPITLTYPTVDTIVDFVITHGRGCLLFKRDLRKAYRQLPVDPADYHYLGYSWNNELYFDTVWTMGLRSAAMACQHTTSAVTWILSQRGYTICNYLDDFIGVEPACHAETVFSDLGTLLWKLGLIESVSKASPPSTVAVCLGVEIDTVNFTVSVSSERLLELQHLLPQWLNKRTATKSALQSLIGKLVFVSKCVQQSRVFISRILELF